MNSRAVRRLAIARGLLHLAANVDVLTHSRSFSQDRQDEVSGLVDSVEDYGREEQRLDGIRGTQLPRCV